MSPCRLVPLQVLQDHSLNIDQLQAVVSGTPSDEDPWSVQLVELLDHSIANHFPHFDFLKWQLVHPELSTFRSDEETEGQIPTPVFGHPTPEVDIALMSLDLILLV